MAFYTVTLKNDLLLRNCIKWVANCRDCFMPVGSKMALIVFESVILRVIAERFYNIKLLCRLEKGEQCMSFKEFDLSDYISALEDFKNNSTDDVIKHVYNGLYFRGRNIF